MKTLLCLTILLASIIFVLSYTPTVPAHESHLVTISINNQDVR